MPSAIATFLSIFKINVFKRTRYFYFPYAKAVNKLLYCLKKELLISGFSLNIASQPKGYFVIYLKYHKFIPLFSSLFLNAKKKFFFTFSSLEIKKFQHQKKSNFFPILILQNGQGFISDRLAEQTNHGGKVIAILR